MPKNLSIASIIEKNKLASDQPWLPAMKIDVVDSAGAHVEYIRVVRNSEDVTIDGELYLALPFDITVNESSESVPTLQVAIKDTTQIVQSYMQNYQGGIGFKVDFMVVTGLDPDTMSVETDLLETFYVVDASASSYVVTWELGVFNPLRMIVPRRQQRKNLCSFSFKSAECAYAGADATCNRTLVDCRSKSNASNFGGFPNLSPV